MLIERVTMQNPQDARGIVIVIDVIRAFSVAAYAFAGGAYKLWLVRGIEEAFTLKQHEPDALLIGEQYGRLIAGFDLNNSPTCIQAADVYGKLLIQRTGAGTQGAVRARNAEVLLIASLVNAQATASYARTLAEEQDERERVITFLPTSDNRILEQGEPDEDVVCADYIEALLLGKADAREQLLKGVEALWRVGRFAPFVSGDADVPREDVNAVLAVDRFGFAIVGRKERWEEVEYVEVEKVS